MDEYTSENDSINSERLFFKINNKQVVFKTDKRTVEKLNDGTFKKTKYLFFFVTIFRIRQNPFDFRHCIQSNNYLVLS